MAKKRPIKLLVIDKGTKTGARVHSFKSMDSEELQKIIARSVGKVRRSK